MLYTSVLALHLLAAALTGGVIAYTLYALYYRLDASYHFCALALGSVAAFEVLSGAALAVLSPELSAAALSIHIVEYLGVCLFVGSLVFLRMRKNSLVFPLRVTVSPVLASVFLFVAAISFGF